MSEKARALALENYEWRTVVPRLVLYYQEAVAECEKRAENKSPKPLSMR